jgi:hypothetical protein
MDSAQINIVTIYSATAARRSGRAGVRILAILSLVFCAWWFNKLEREINPWLGMTAGAALINEASTAASQHETDPWAQLGLRPSSKPAPKVSREEQQQLDNESMQRSAVIGIGRMVWPWTARVAGGSVALAGLWGLLLGSPRSVKMHRLAAYLVIFSAILSLAGMWAAIRYGGMPEIAPKFYVEIGLKQSAYGWFLLLVTRFLR